MHKDSEALQELYQLCPDLNSQSVWFFPTLKKSAEDHILYEKSEDHVYVYDIITQNRFSSFSAWIKALNGKRFFKDKKSALATIFLNSSYNGMSIDQIIKGDYISYFKSIEIIILSSIKDTLMTMICNDAEFADVTLNESDKVLQLIFSDKVKIIEKELYIKQAPHGYQEPIKCSIFVNDYEVGDDILKKNGITNKILVIRFKNNHEIIANLENKGSYNEAYHRVNCTLLILDGNICLNCKMLHNTLYKIEKWNTDSIQSIKTSHAFREVLAELVQNTQKFEAEEDDMSELLTKIVHNMIKEVKNKEHKDIPNVILKELVHIQSEKPKGTNQHMDWQDKTAEQILASMKRDNKYIGYVDFDNENAELEVFGKQYLCDIQNHIDNYEQTKNENEKDHEHALVTQEFIHMDQFVMVQVKIEDTLKALISLQQPGKTYQIFSPALRHCYIILSQYYAFCLTASNINNYLDIEVAIETARKVQLVVWKSLFNDIRPVYDENQHWV
ncbi:5275_t:CDS:2 [Ambispora leptoticha]|uniref:5275_t:CDS:1 n=1 Tax=Ambispora leptoticha TaxID=144679 RepID=A0A9N9A1D3_9GLOM|nr:5275_t:CDS:2 [Ambispora leptoticha]